MLTASEREWVAWKIRIRCDESIAPAWCHHCQHLGKDWGSCYQQRYCPLFSCNWEDAAEFEARVAAKLASIDFQPIADTRPSARLKYARIAVEEEIDADMDH